MAEYDVRYHQAISQDGDVVDGMRHGFFAGDDMTAERVGAEWLRALRRNRPNWDIGGIDLYAEGGEKVATLP